MTTRGKDVIIAFKFNLKSTFDKLIQKTQKAPKKNIELQKQSFDSDDDDPLFKKRISIVSN